MVGNFALHRLYAVRYRTRVEIKNVVYVVIL
jgi:hypothetical protein